MAINIPVAGDPVPEGRPSVFKILQVTFGPSNEDVDVSGSAVGDVVVAELPAGSYIYDVGWRVSKAFNALVDLVIGDSGDTDGWAEVAQINATAAAANIKWASRGTYTDDAISSDAYSTQQAYAESGRLSVPGDTGLNLHVGIATTPASAGILEVYVVYTMAYAQKASTV